MFSKYFLILSSSSDDLLNKVYVALQEQFGTLKRGNISGGPLFSLSCQGRGQRSKHNFRA